MFDRACHLAAWVLLFVALMAVGAEGLRTLEIGQYRPLALGEIWYAFDRDSLNLAQAAIQRHLLPWLWDPVIVWILRLPGWLIPGLAGAALLYRCRARRRKKIFAAR